MKVFIILFALVLGVGTILLVPDVNISAPALLLCLVLALPVGFILHKWGGDHRGFILQLFFGGLLIRMTVAVLIYVFNLQVFFGADALSYDDWGYAMAQMWQGDYVYKTVLYESNLETFKGMIYLVAVVYSLLGRNSLAVQFITCIMGAATAPLVFMCARHIFQNISVARITGLYVALYPSLILWSAQVLKDAPVVFFLTLSMLATMKLGEKLSVKYILLLVGALICLLNIRFYIFYMVVAAVAGSFLIGMRAVTAQSLFRQGVVVISVGLALTYLGVLRTANTQVETFGSLQRIQTSRQDMSQSAQSGFGKDVDVSTTSGAISTIPIGMAYLLLAPFPWQLANLRQSITLPEMLVWWASFPLLILGLWFTIKYRLRPALPILIFTTMLTLAYSIFQGNVGTAYRQRAQLLVFYFIFVAVGIVLIREKREERRQQQALALKQRVRVPVSAQNL